ncbi:MAG: rhodanese-like domain-containing protein, partial [Oscillospiraceae bacterium]|nr:rhodanese-like domain-containing protein [Oscillospiraceae bacterium]
STAIHPFAHAVNVLLNKLEGAMDSLTPAEYAAGAAEDYRIIDCSQAPTLEGRQYLDFTSIQGPVDGLEKDEKLLLVCTKGRRAYLTQNRLMHYGYPNTKVLEGGTSFTEIEDGE